MSEEIVEALESKRAELVDQVEALHSKIYTLNETIRMLGFDPGKRKPPHSRFRRGELMALVGRAEREGKETPAQIATYIMQAKGWDLTDKPLLYRIRMRVRDCLRRLRDREGGHAKALE